MHEYHLPLRVLNRALEHADHRRQTDAATDQHDWRFRVYVDIKRAVRRGEFDFVAHVHMLVKQRRHIARRPRSVALLAFDGDAIAAPIRHVGQTVLANLYATATTGTSTAMLMYWPGSKLTTGCPSDGSSTNDVITLLSGRFSLTTNLRQPVQPPSCCVDFSRNSLSIPINRSARLPQACALRGDDLVGGGVAKVRP